jgi:excisionase family DNA binding protein
MNSQILLTEPEAAERLRVCTRTLRKARKEGTLHYVLIGRSVRYTVQDLESFGEGLRKVEPACPPPASTRRTSVSRAKRTGAVIVPFKERNKRR